MLVALVRSGRGDGGGTTVSRDDRERWLAQVPATRAGRGCTCGTCPSIELTDATGSTPGTEGDRVVLSGSTSDAVLLLFIDDDRLSYLELAPLSDSVARHRFPHPADIDFGR